MLPSLLPSSQGSLSLAASQPLYTDEGEVKMLWILIFFLTFPLSPQGSCNKSFVGVTGVDMNLDTLRNTFADQDVWLYRSLYELHVYDS